MVPEGPGYAVAFEALAQARRLLAPMVQVNIAERQNIAQIAGGPVCSADGGAEEPTAPAAELSPG